MSDFESLEPRVRALEEDSERNRETHREFYRRIRDLEQTSGETKIVLNDLKEIKADVKELKEKPGKRWDNAVTSILQWLIVGALAASQLFNQ